MVGIGKVVIDRLRDSHANQLVFGVRCQLVDLVGSVHRIVAAGIEKIPDIVGLKDVQHPLEIRFGFFDRF